MKKNSKVENYILISVFMLLVVLPLISFVLPIDHTPYMLENRRLVTEPGFENLDDAIGNFPEKFEPFFNDQFGFRRIFVRISNFLNSRFEGNIVADMVLTGKDGWLYRHMQYYYRHEYPMQEKDLEIARNTLLARNKWLNDRGIKHLIVICPLKASIYPEFLPETMTRPEGISMVDELVGYLKQYKKINIVDLRPVLKEARKEQDVFTPSDFHWNDYGAMVASGAIGEKLKEWFPQINVPKADGFTITRKDKLGGELAAGLGLSNVFKREEVLYKPRDSDNSYYRYFTNRGGLLLADNGLDVNPNIMFVHDSFGEKPRKFLSQIAKKSVFYWDVALRKNLVEAWQPDVVVEMFMETNLLKNVVNEFWPDTDIFHQFEGTEFEISLPAGIREVELKVRTLNYSPQVQKLKFSWGGKVLAPKDISRKDGMIKIQLPELQQEKEFLLLKADYSAAKLPKKRMKNLALPFNLYLASASRQRPSGLYYLQGEMKETEKGYSLIHLSEKGESKMQRAFDISNFPIKGEEFVREIQALTKAKDGYLLILSHSNIKKGFTPEIGKVLKQIGSQAPMKREPHMGHLFLYDLKNRKVLAEYSGTKSGVIHSGDSPIEEGFIISGLRLK